jgi:membrane-bound serine protease (ClpP class)
LSAGIAELPDAFVRLSVAFDPFAGTLVSWSESLAGGPSQSRLQVGAFALFSPVMKRVAAMGVTGALTALAALLLTPGPNAFAAEAGQSVCILTIHEDITHNTLFLIRRGLREAEEKKAAAVVLDMNTNGGRVDVTEEIIRLLEHAPMKTYTFVNDKAYSAGAFIAAGTDKIFMAPGSVIGAATPVMLIPGSGVQELPKAYQEKLSSALRARIRATAQEKGHNPEVFEAMVDADRGFTIDDTEITAKGKLLTLTGEEAAREYGDPPKPLLSAGTVRNLEALLEKVGLADARRLEVTPYGFEVLARWITMISPLLVLVGFLAIYIELKTPGIGVPALVALICFGVYFIGFFVAGLAGKEELVLFGVGIILLAVEIFILPGFGFTGMLGITAILVALVLAMTEYLPGGPMLPTWPQLRLPVAKVLGGFLGSIVGILIIGRYLPQTSLFRKMELSAATNAAEGYTSSRGEAKALLGATGVAETILRPSGKGRFGDQLVDVVTEGDLIDKGQPIKIALVEGSRVVVTRAA